MEKIKPDRPNFLINSATPETVLFSLPTSERRQPQVTRFNPDQKDYLENDGWVIFGLTGESIISLINSGKKITRSEWFINQYPELARLQSLKSEVAINLNQLYLPNSERKSFREQQVMVRGLEHRISKNIDGVSAIIGELPDYAELFFMLPPILRKPKESLNPVEVRTNTPIMRGLEGKVYTIAEISDFGPDQGLEINDSDPLYSLPNKLVAPLLIPSIKNGGKRRRIRVPSLEFLRKGQLFPNPSQL